MLHFYTKPPVPADEIQGRLLPARALGSSGIPFVVFAEDALAFVHFVPTYEFQFTVLVPDELVQEAVQHLQKEIPSYHVTQGRDYRLLDKNGVCALPRAVQLQWDASEEKELLHTPEEILIVPQSHFHFDVNDPTRSRGLIPPFDPSNSRILFPTMPAFLDAIIDSMFEPVDGVSHLYFKMSYLSCFLSYLVLYNVRDYDGCTDPATDELLPAAKALLEGVKAENLPFLETFMRTGSTRLTPPEVRAERERIKATRLAPPSKPKALLPPTIRGITSPGSCAPVSASGNKLHARPFSTKYHAPTPPTFAQSILRVLRTKKLLR